MIAGNLCNGLAKYKFAGFNTTQRSGTTCIDPLIKFPKFISGFIKPLSSKPLVVN